MNNLFTSKIDSTSMMRVCCLMSVITACVIALVTGIAVCIKILTGEPGTLFNLVGIVGSISTLVGALLAVLIPKAVQSFAESNTNKSIVENIGIPDTQNK